MHEYDLLEIKREIVEGRALSIKTNNLVSALSADVKSISKRQIGYERRMTLHSTAAYVVTVLVILGLSKVALDAQVGLVRSEAEQQKARLAALEKEVKAAEQKTEKRNVAMREASALYDLITSRDDKAILEKIPSALSLELSPIERKVFEEAGRRARHNISVASYQAGVEHLAKGRYHEASIALRDAIDLEYDSPFTPSAMYQLARAFRALGEQKRAIPLLMTLTESGASAEVQDEATLLLAECQIDAELYSDAKVTLRQFLRRFEKSPLRLEARQKLSELELKH
ncbi:MAG: hypothetical protein B6A08_07380 [Sorangiineae bacterium NIC37A_2]|jgi:TolA-binding protein|nr:MAG: hypothetical protein B6A08_07380 [Sorangiineae bacterium NIC37A_2]